MKRMLKIAFFAVIAFASAQLFGYCCSPTPSQGHCEYQTVQQICKNSRESGYVLKDGSGRIVALKPGGLCPKCNHPGFNYTTDKKGISVLFHSCDRDGFAQTPPVEIVDDSNPSKPCPF